MKTAILTGASSGIGYETALELLKLGYKVYGIGKEFKSPINNKNFIEMVIDLKDIPSLTKEINLLNKKEEINLLINNAGVGFFGLHEEINQKKISELITINLEVPILITNLLLRNIKKAKGTIINISSITAKKASPKGAAYSATKAGLTHFSKSLFAEVRKYGVKVIVIHPDIVKSNFYRNANFKQDDEKVLSYIYPKEIAKQIKNIITQREGLVITDITLEPQIFSINKNK